MKLTEQIIEEMILEELKEATGEQKRQQKKANWDSRDKQRKKLKAKIKRSQVKKPVESPIKGEPTDFDPIKDMGKIFGSRRGSQRRPDFVSFRPWPWDDPHHSRYKIHEGSGRYEITRRRWCCQ